MYTQKAVQRLIKAAEILYGNMADADQTCREEDNKELDDVKELRRAAQALKRQGDIG